MEIDKTVQAVFDKAMYLIDAQNDSTGSTVNQDTQEYRVRTLGILNSLLDQVYPASDTYPSAADGIRPALPDLRSFDDTPDLDARILREVLPYGLAARLLTEENPTLAGYFQQCFAQGLHSAGKQNPASFESVGGAALEHGQFARW